MLNLWNQTQERAKRKSNSRSRSPTPGPRNPEHSRPLKKRKTTNASNPLELPRPTITTQKIFPQTTEGNVITVVESPEEKRDALRVALGLSIIEQQTSAQNKGHRVVLFVVDDNQSLDHYAAQLEEMDFAVAPYTLSMHSSSTSQWPSIIYNDVIVVPVNMLLDSLVDGSFKLSQAHLLVISDVQRVVPMLTPHPVIRIINDHYSKTPDAPKLLAMFTCSPERWSSLDLQWLEASLKARSWFLVTNTIDSWFGPTELVVEYDVHPQQQPEPQMSIDLRKIDPHGNVIGGPLYRRASRLFRQLGSFAAGHFWKHAADDIAKHPGNADQLTLAKLDVLTSTQRLDVHTSSPTCNVSPKFARLLQVLRPCAKYGSEFYGVIFVKDKVVAETLVELLQLPDLRLPFIRPLKLRKPYGDALKRFASGFHNLFVLTKSFQDIIIPQASIVINFDIFDDQLWYAYSQAGSKGRHSHLVHMVEKGNNEHRNIVAHLQTADNDLRAWIAHSRQGTSGLPPVATRIGTDAQESESEDDNDDPDFIEDAATSARLYKSDAVAALYRFAAEVRSSLGPMEDNVQLLLEHEPERNDDPEYRYRLIFPAKTMLPSFTGPFCGTKWEARREACFQACQELLHAGIMCHLHFPQRHTHSSSELDKQDEPTASQDIKTANTSAQTHGYPRKNPDFWRHSHSSDTPPTILFPTVIVPDSVDGQPYAPVILLTTAPLPGIPNFSLFFNGQRTEVHTTRASPLQVADAQLRALHGYTVRATRSLTNKPFECPYGSLLCYLAPLRDSWHTTHDARWPLPDVANHIPWDAVELAADYYAIPLVDRSASIDERADDAIVLDRQVEYTMRHFVLKVRHDLTPLSKAEDSPREAEYPNFLEYCKARCKDFQGLDDESQPMIEVSAVPGAMNLLHPTSSPPTPSVRLPLKYLVPELCYKFTIPASTYRTLWLVPSIMNKLDSFLLTKELNARFFSNTIMESQLLTALYSRAAWTEHNYERLEFLGDSFLKVMASNFCYVTAPTSEAGELHTARQSIISNRALQEDAARIGLPSYIQHKRFVAKMWQPPFVTPSSPVPAPKLDDDGDVQMAPPSTSGDLGGGEPSHPKDKGKRSKKQRQQDEQNTLWMGDKIVADVVEALLAAAFLSGGHDVALTAARRLRVRVPNVARWADFARLAADHVVRPEGTGKGKGKGVAGTGSGAAVPRAMVERLEAALGVTFTRPELLDQALTHMSVASGGSNANYDRLEFVGDAVLDFLVSRYIWDRHPHLSPGGLTMLKGAMVSNQTLAAFCVHIGLHQHMYIDSGDLKTAIQKYVNFLWERQRTEYALAEQEQRLPGQYWLDVPMEPPKVLSDVVESVVGALYVGDSFFETNVAVFFDGAFKKFLEAHIRLQTLSANPKVTLLELLQAEGCQDNAVMKRPSTRPNMPVTMEVVVHGKVVATAEDPSVAIATRKVSLMALELLTSDPELLARTCDCKSATSTKSSAQKKPDAASQDPTQDNIAADVDDTNMEGGGE